MASNWTTDADGNYVDWTQPPHYVDGVVNLLLPGESGIEIDELAKRRLEFIKLRLREIRRNKKPGPEDPGKTRQKTLNY